MAALDFRSNFGFEKWASFADTLVILVGIIADDIWLFHFHTELLLGEVDGREDGEIGVALAAARTTDVANLAKGLCRHLMRQCKRLLC